MLGLRDDAVDGMEDGTAHGPAEGEAVTHKAQTQPSLIGY